MFRGSVPTMVFRLTDEHVREWTSDTVYVGCSGAFTVERHLAQYGKKLHSNDVLLYSAAIGGYCSGNPYPLALTEQGREEVPFIEPYLDEPDSALAAMFVASGLAVTVGKTRDGSPYYKKLAETYEKQFPQMHEKMLEEVRGFDLRLESYTSEDVTTWIDRVPDDAAVMAYPPFQASGAASYFQRDFSILERIFQYDEPEYVPMEGDALTDLYLKIADRREWAFATNKPVPELADSLKGIIQTTNRAPHIHLYGSHGKKRLVTPHQGLEPVPYPHLGADEELGDEMTLEPITNGQFSTLRSLYMNKGIKPGEPDMAHAVLVDGVLVGAIAWDLGASFAKWDRYVPQPAAYLLSDFPVDGTRYPRLSKLVVMAATSVEAAESIRGKASKAYRAFTTTAFSNNPVSMKYRGVLDLLKREENDAYKSSYADNLPEDDSYYGRPWNLQYGARIGEQTCAELLDTWKTKHGKERKR